METVADAVVRALGSAGVGVLYGEGLGRLPVVRVPPGRVARLVAAAHWRVTGVRAASHDGDAVVRLAGALTGDPRVVTVRAPADAAELGPLLDTVGPAACELVLDVDLDAPVPAGSPPGNGPPAGYRDPGEAAERLAGARSPVMLAGPGVLAAGAVRGLHALATAGGLGVLNTWGAKGVFDWRSRHHWATVGLQERDFVLGGLAGADLVLGVGIDESESPAERWRLGPVLELEPEVMGALAERLAERRARSAAHARHGDVPGTPPLRSRLAGVTEAGWSRTSPPLAPSRVTLAYGSLAARSGLVAADPGVAGYWVARTVATTRPGSVLVPAARDARGFAVAAAMVARLAQPWRPVVAVVDAPVGSAVLEMAEVARGLGAGVGLEVWDPEGPRLAAGDHSERLSELATPGPRGSWVALATDGSQLEEMVAAAGEVVAWA